MKKNCAILIFFLFPVTLLAGGFQLNTQGQKAMSLGGSVTGYAMDASASFFNPGALAALDSNYFNAGFTAIMPKTTFLGLSGDEEQMESNLFLPFHIYANYNLGSRWSLGFSLNTPFGLGTEWPDDWSGRYVTTRASLSDISVQPAVACKINDWLSAGAGVSVNFGSAHLRKSIPVSNADGSDAYTELEGKATGFGFNAGLYAEFGKATMGFSYRSTVGFDIDDGTATFSNVPSSLVNNGTFPSESSFSTSLTLPSVVSFGMSYHVSQKIRILLDLNYTGWDVYDSLNFEFSENPEFNSSEVKKYKNSMAGRLGVIYDVKERLSLRGGLALDGSPVPDGYENPELPDADKTVFSAGMTYRLSPQFCIDVSLMFEDLRERGETDNQTDNFNGTYKSYIYAAGIGLQYRF